MTTTDTLVAVYENGGQSGVEGWVMANHPEWGWARCEPCETMTPTYEDVCAVCFTVRAEGGRYGSDDPTPEALADAADAERLHFVEPGEDD